MIFLLVCCQGIMGGLRVTGRFTLEEVPLIDEAANLRWAVAHGVLAQIILGGPQPCGCCGVHRGNAVARDGRAVRSFRFFLWPLVSCN